MSAKENSTLTPFRKIMVANRGEIAVRILRACGELGIPSVAVYSDADRKALHVRYADECYHIGAAPAKDSYLNIPKLIEVARQSGADAIHPGYGFLAENAEFARVCQESGIVFIGPSPEAIQVMGDKILSRQTVKAAGVPVVPGSDGPVGDEQEAIELAEGIGFPLVVKATAGGGGKGMRIVNRPDELRSALHAAASEANAAFGDSKIYIEKYMENVRHVEIQVLADRRGNMVHLGERECSIQRRHQKVVEESPSPAMHERIRNKMGAVAIEAAKSVNYESAGTVEFLLDKDKNFYFIEMNTRIQVEHAVTEMVTGVDLVIEQIRIAAGRRLRYRQRDIHMNGWAIECRISAEDPFNDFLPSTGVITNVYEPSGPGIRLDSAAFAGAEIQIYYDPLIAKLIAWGETRGQAVLRMRRALREFKLLGIKTTLPFHQRLMDSPSFIAGRLDTKFLERNLPEQGIDNADLKQVSAIAAAAIAHRANSVPESNDQVAPVVETSSWRKAGRRWAMRGTMAD